MEIQIECKQCNYSGRTLIQHEDEMNWKKKAEYRGGFGYLRYVCPNCSSENHKPHTIL